MTQSVVNFREDINKAPIEKYLQYFPSDIYRSILSYKSYAQLVCLMQDEDSIFSKLIDDTKFWAYKAGITLEEFNNQIVGENNISACEKYLKLYSKNNCTYGSEKYNNLDICFYKAGRLANITLINYLIGVAKNQNYNIGMAYINLCAGLVIGLANINTKKWALLHIFINRLNYCKEISHSWKFTHNYRETAIIYCVDEAYSYLNPQMMNNFLRTITLMNRTTLIYVAITLSCIYKDFYDKFVEGMILINTNKFEGYKYFVTNHAIYKSCKYNREKYMDYIVDSCVTHNAASSLTHSISQVLSDGNNLLDYFDGSVYLLGVLEKRLCILDNSFARDEISIIMRGFIRKIFTDNSEKLLDKLTVTWPKIIKGMTRAEIFDVLDDDNRNLLYKLVPFLNKSVLKYNLRESVACHNKNVDTFRLLAPDTELKGKLTEAIKKINFEAVKIAIDLGAKDIGHSVDICQKQISTLNEQISRVNKRKEKLEEILTYLKEKQGKISEEERPKKKMKKVKE